MKSITTDKLSHRILAALMALIMAFTLIPISWFNVSAATDQYPKGVTVRVIDESGNPVIGANVTYTVASSEDSVPDIKGEKTTDNDGTVEVLTEEQFDAAGSNILTLSAEISKAEYQTDNLSILGAQITSGTANFEVSIKSVKVPGITVEGVNELYREEGHNAAKVEGMAEGDIISYQINGTVVEEPTIKDVGTYSVTVTVQRSGYQNFEATVTSTIEENTIPDNSITASQYQRDYDKNEHDAIYNIEGLKNTDDVAYTLDGGALQDTVPKITNAKKYSLTIIVKRKGYHEFRKTFADIEVFPIEIDGVAVSAYEGVYDRSSHPAVTVSKKENGDVVEFSEAGANAWSSNIPMIENAGDYNYDVRVTRPGNSNYKTTNIPSVTAKIAKAGQTLTFDNYQSASSSITVQGLPPYAETYDFTATDRESLAGGSVTYRVETADADIAEISGDNGQLVVKGTGTIKVIAELSGNGNYETGVAEHELTVKAEPQTPGQFISLDKTDVRYVLGENGGIVSNRTASGIVEGTFSYSIDNPDLGLSCNASTGAVQIEDYAILGAAIHKNNGSATVNVTVKKEATAKYGEDSTSYRIVISFAEAPAGDPYNITSGTLGNNGWYTSNINVSASDADYKISKTFLPEDFVSNVGFEDEGAGERYVYLRNTLTGGITDKILLDGVKIDKTRPDSNDIKIFYSDPVSERGMLGFYDSYVTITFAARDEISGIDSFSWSYTREKGVSAANLASASGIIGPENIIQDSKDPALYKAELRLPEKDAVQLRGNISVVASDKAGLDSLTKTDTGKVIVVDTISPHLNAFYQLESLGGKTQEVGEHIYYSDNVEFTFRIEEANFFAEDYTVKIAKDGGSAQEETVEWNSTGNLDEYEAKIILSDDGDYIVSMEWENENHPGGDLSEHKMQWKPSGKDIQSYESHLITVDKKAPVIGFSYADYSAEKDAQTAKITITERNFRQTDVEVETFAEDITGKQIALDLQEYLRSCIWNSDGEVHTAVISSQFVDAVYQLKINYKDLALNKAQELVTDNFIVDRTAPAVSSMTVTYSEPILESVLSAITFGFYNPSVTMTFCADDMTSGVDYFTWTYQRESGISNINVKDYTDVRADAVQDSSDKFRFTASVTLPRAEAEQLRGNIAFTATDKCNNKSSKLTDRGNIIVVDTIAPTIEAEYSESNRTVNKKMYYNKAAVLSFTVTEANFFKEDFIVEVSKDGEEFKKENVSWTDKTTDIHEASYTIKAPKTHSKDGDYVVRLSYTDRSSNKMKTYISRTIVIDTKRPVIHVSYENKNVVDTSTDINGKERKYFDAVQTAKVTIDEHNFNAKEVNFTIKAEDSAGNVLDVNNVSRKSSWSTDGDKHTVTITYQGDADYTFDVEYTDLATNQAENYKEDYFTVDKTAPANLNISYSTGILETIIESITFGFYNAPVTVTIEAEDDTSGVHGFQYSYYKADGVSSVNAELVDQMIEESEITYTNNRQKATVMFDIPKDALGDNNQFNGIVGFTAVDRSGNESAELQDTERIVVDNISPTAEVEYNTPVQMVNGASYYDETITATITINEANFYAEDVEVTVTKDGAAYPANTAWSDNNTDVHTGTLSLTEDGDYFISISYTDKSSNEMVVYTSDQLTLDTDIAEPEITINGQDANGMSYKEDVSLEIGFDDINFENYEIMLTRTSYAQKNVDVTNQFIAGHMSLKETGGRGVFNQFDKTAENDGIYRLEVAFTDKAGHESKTETMFTINRFGSVYEYSDYLVSLIEEGGAYRQEITDDLIITEYNADRLVNDSLNIEISCDGKPLTDSGYTVTPEINQLASTGSSGWYQYQYTIDKDNFKSDGVYKIFVSSADEAGNMPENTNYDDKSILFRVDSTKPEIESIVGLESSIINAMEVTVNYTVYDTMGLSSVEVYVSDNKVSEITDFSTDSNNYSGSFILTENSSPQTVQLVVKDLAGNAVDTDAVDFNSEYDFNKSVTVSTNFFVRFYANKPLFWGLAGALAAAVVFILGFILIMRRKKEKEKDEA